MNYETVNGTTVFIDSALENLGKISTKIDIFLTTDLNDKTALKNAIENIVTVLTEAKENMLIVAREMEAIEKEVKGG